ncbi:hypothetical protein SK128_007427 [Halocaridina rubra]|uniref:Uncharacterized protein n=1 Tax=Halocaridina rubra TaxID=373956 RepID=A0AAN8XKD5_HALRR
MKRIICFILLSSLLIFGECRPGETATDVLSEEELAQLISENFRNIFATTSPSPFRRRSGGYGKRSVPDEEAVGGVEDGRSLPEDKQTLQLLLPQIIPIEGSVVRSGRRRSGGYGK